jgi:hypothetical protein
MFEESPLRWALSAKFPKQQNREAGEPYREIIFDSREFVSVHSRTLVFEVSGRDLFSPAICKDALHKRRVRDRAEVLVPRTGARRNGQ